MVLAFGIAFVAALVDQVWTSQVSSVGEHTAIRKSALAATPLVGLVLFLITVEVLTATLRAHGRPENGLFVLLRVIGWGGWLGWWYEDDCRARRATPAFDMGFFLALAWPLLIVRALFSSRRWQMLLMIATFIAVYAIAKLVGLAVYALLTP